jgi:beta-lactamase regulating signal transducer with metallopeptidase domain
VSGELVRALGEASLHIAALAVVALVLERALGGRLSPRVRLWLWLVVVVRLALPVLPEVPRAFAPPTERLARVWVAPPDTTRVTERALRAELASTGETSPTPATAITTATESASAARTTPLIPAQARATSRGPSMARYGVDALAILWLVGAAVSLGRLVRGELRLRSALRVAHPAPAALVAQVQVAARRAGLGRVPRVVLTDAVHSPAVHGLVHATILVPPRLLTLDAHELDCVLAHECSHVRRGDLALAPLCAILRAVWWFHPLARLALARVADALEEARDADALRILDEPSVAPNTGARVRYARVLVTLAESRASDVSPSPTLGALAMAVRPRGLTRRVHMILVPHRSSLSRRLVGASTVVALGWLGLVAAAPTRPSGGPLTDSAELAPALQSSASPGSSSTPQKPQQHIAVESPAPVPEWRLALEAKLALRLPVTLDKAALTDAIRQVAAAAGIDVTFGTDIEANLEGYWVTLAVSDVTTREVLDVLCEYGPELGYTLVPSGDRGGVLFVGNVYELPRAVELRLYKVSGLLEVMRRPFGTDDVSMDDLIELVRHFSDAPHDVWDVEGTSLSSWEGLLCVRQTPEVHAEVHTFLERLAARQLAPDHSGEHWRAGLEAKLAAPVRVGFEDSQVSEAVEMLASQGGVSIIDPELEIDDYNTEGAIGLVLRDVTLEESLRRCLAPTGFFLGLRAGAVEIRREPRAEVYLHPIGALLEGLDAERRDERFNGVEEFLRSTVDPDSWDMYPGIAYHRVADLLVVRQSVENQARIRALLAQLERALRG